MCLDDDSRVVLLAKKFSRLNAAHCIFMSIALESRGVEYSTCQLIQRL